MRNQRPGCLTPIGIIAMLVTILVLAGTGWASGGALFSPGGLSARSGPALGGARSHADLGGKCGACHTAPWDSTPMSARCADCHRQVESDLADPTTLHGGLVHSAAEANCLDCHTEHHGAQAMLTRLDVQNFPHDVTGFSLKSHAKMATGAAFRCEDCHGTRFAPVTATTCQDCHRRIDRGYMAGHLQAFGVACRNCHDGVESLGKAFDHARATFTLAGAHAGTQCQGCHVQQASLAALRATPVECASCHRKDDPHQGILGAGCADCHSTGAWKPDTFDHNARAGFRLDGKHLDASCASCHTTPDLKGTPMACAACHQKDDAHQGVLGTDCAACHTTAGWQRASFDHAARTGFALTGKHAGATCAGCHTTPDLKNTAQECAACHAKDDFHQGKFGQDCAACHTAQGWKPASFDHNARAGFALTGRHAAIQCTACHTSDDPKKTPSTCAACHSPEDPHKGQLGANCAGCHSTSAWKPVTFNHNQAPFKLAGKHISVSCAACHSDKVFKTAPTRCAACHAKDDFHKGQMGSECALCHGPAGWKPSTFNHASTAFPLTGAHQSAQCSACHANNAFKGTSTSCAACHSKNDAHKGALGANCAACHSTSAWKPSTFSHARSAFPLTGAHQSVQCSACHANNTFKGTPTTCSACHSAQDAHKGSLGTNCVQCHSTSAWKPSTFSHARSAFPLTGAHQSAQCSACHANQVFKGTPTDCAACHSRDDAHGGSLGANCATCHSTSAWKPSTFSHARTAFPLTGAHQSTNCASCHANNTFKGTPTACGACHARNDAHGGQFGTDCGKCHTTSGWGGATFDHNLSGFPLTGAHARVACTSCHASGYSNTPSACSACHGQPAYHAGLFGSDCAACHSTAGWLPAGYSGSHSFPRNHGGASSCKTCHTTSLSSYTCYACHNQNEMIKKHQEKNIADLTNCARCHPTGHGD